MQPAPRDLAQPPSTTAGVDPKTVFCGAVNPSGQAQGHVSFVASSMRLEYETFREAGYVKSFDELKSEYAQYVQASTFLSILRGGDVVGTARIIDWSEAGFKTLDDIDQGRLQSNGETPVHFPDQTFDLTAAE